MGDRSLWINRDDDVAHPNAPIGSRGPGYFRAAAALGKDLDADVTHPFSPAGRNLVPDDWEQLQATGGGPTNAASADETPTFTSTSPVPVSITADTVDDFVAKSNSAMGDGGSVGHMQPTINTDMEFDTATNRVIKVNMTVDTKIVRPRFAGGRGSDAEKALIKKAEELIKKHEERHRDIAKDFMTRAVKAMHGKTTTEAQKVLNKFIKDMEKAQEEFDSKEGMLYVDHNGPNGKAGPATDVRTGPIPKANTNP